MNEKYRMKTKKKRKEKINGGNKKLNMEIFFKGIVRKEREKERK